MNPAATQKAASSSAAIAGLEADEDQQPGDQFEQAGRPGREGRGRQAERRK